MANDGTAGTGSEEGLKASVVEQLREKAHLEEEAARERRADEERAAGVERQKEAERSEVARHGAEAASWPATRQGARRAPVRRRAALATWLPVALLALLAARLLTRRSS